MFACLRISSLVFSLEVMVLVLRMTDLMLKMMDFILKTVVYRVLLPNDLGV